MTMKTPKPTRVLKPFDNSNIEIRLFGRPRDWSIAALNEEGLKKLADETGAAFAKIHGITADARVQTLYAPRPTEFNAVVCDHKDLQLTFSTDMDAMVEADFPENWDISVCLGVNADGCDVPKGSAFWLSSADCPTLIVTDGRRVICAHCGYKSLVDLQALVGKPTRPYFSVVDAVIAEFTKISVPPKKLKAFVTLGIGPHFVVMRSVRQEIDHEGDRILVYEKEKFATHEANWKKARFFKTTPSYDIATDIRKLTECQCLNRGIGDVRTDDNDTFADKDKDGKFLWWSYERAMKQSPADKLKRNGVMVIHR